MAFERDPTPPIEDISLGSCYGGYTETHTCDVSRRTREEESVLLPLLANARKLLKIPHLAYRHTPEW